MSIHLDVDTTLGKIAVATRPTTSTLPISNNQYGVTYDFLKDIDYLLRIIHVSNEYAVKLSPYRGSDLL